MKASMCKFISTSSQKSLSTSKFIFETDKEVMTSESGLGYNYMYLVTQGEGVFVFDKKREHLTLGSVAFGFSGERLSVEPSHDCEYMYIAFEGLRADELFKRFSISKEERSFHGFDGLVPMWQESLSRACEDTVDLASESILLYTFSRLRTKGAEHSDLVSKIIQISEEEFSDIQLSVATISERLNYNPKYLSHAFKQEMGITYSEYLRELRIKFAVSLFDNGLDSVKNVAFLSGFSDSLYFSSVFKKSVGVSPTEYKAKR